MQVAASSVIKALMSADISDFIELGHCHFKVVSFSFVINY